MSDLSSFLGTVIRSATPVLFVALGVLINQTSGIVNMGAEGMMLIGCLTAVAATVYTGNIWLGALIAALVVGVVGLLFAFLVLEFQINQVVLGVAFNMLGAGITTTLFRGMFGSGESRVAASFGTGIFGLSIPIILSFLMVPLIHLFFYRTKPGLKIRSVGEYPKAVESAGLSVKKLRYLSMFLGALLIGLGGAYLSTGQLNMFIEEMTDGRGYIALAAVAFGKYTPVGTMLAVLLFGAGEALQYRLQAGGSEIPYQFALMIPYVITILALALLVKGAASPEALGDSYEKSI